MTVTIPRKARDKVNAFEKAKEVLQEYVSDNEDTFGPFLELVDEYNAAHEDAKAAIRQTPGTEPFSLKSFHRRTAPNKDGYNPALLPGVVLAMDGVVKSVDNDRLNRIAIDEPIYSEAIRKSFAEATGTPAVVGPKKIVLDLG